MKHTDRQPKIEAKVSKKVSIPKRTKIPQPILKKPLPVSNKLESIKRRMSEIVYSDSLTENQKEKQIDILISQETKNLTDAEICDIVQELKNKI